MSKSRNIQFSGGVKCTLAEFKKTYASHLIRLSDSAVKEAYKAHKEAIKK